jgi:RecA/RadA recombinase
MAAAKNKIFEFPAQKTHQEKMKARAALMTSANSDKKKPPVLRTANQVSSTYFLRRPCGITQLDIDTGGGLPAGGLACLSGVDNAGKTTLMFLYCAMHQRIYGEDSMIALSLVEGNPDYDYMRKLGFIVAYPDDLIKEKEKDRTRRGLPKFTKAEVAEMKRQIGVVDFILGETGEEVMDTLINAIRKNIYGIIGLDSVSALQSAAEASKTSFEDNPQQAQDAMLLTRFLKKYYPCMNGLWGKNQTTVLFTQQMKANRAKSSMPSHLAKFAPDVVAAGANALKHGKLFDIYLSKGSKESDKATVEGKEVRTATGRTVKYKFVKAKAGAHDEITGEYDMSYEEGFQQPRTLFVEGIRLGAMAEDKGLITIFKKPPVGEIDYDKPAEEHILVKDIPGIESFIKRCEEDIEFELSIRREVMAFAEKDCIYRE